MSDFRKLAEENGFDPRWVQNNSFKFERVAKALTAERDKQLTELSDQLADTNRCCDALRCELDEANAAITGLKALSEAQSRVREGLEAELAALKQREKACPTMQEAEARALMRCVQEVAAAIGLDVSASPRDIVEGVKSARNELAEANKERAWVRRKLSLQEDTGFLSGEKTLAGTMHNVCAHAKGYTAYIEAGKCEDKQGEIARLTVLVAQRDVELDEAKAAIPGLKLLSEAQSNVWKKQEVELEKYRKQEPVELSSRVRGFLREAINDCTQSEEADCDHGLADDLASLLNAKIYARTRTDEAVAELAAAKVQEPFGKVMGYDYLGYPSIRWSQKPNIGAEIYTHPVAQEAPDLLSTYEAATANSSSLQMAAIKALAPIVGLKPAKEFLDAFARDAGLWAKQKEQAAQEAPVVPPRWNQKIECLIEAARCLGVYQQKNDADAVAYWNAQVDRIGLAMKSDPQAQDFIEVARDKCAINEAELHRLLKIPDRMPIFAAPAAPEGLREKLVDLLANHLHASYFCTRVWSAWGVGTMSEHDFESMSESDWPSEVADEILSVLAAAPSEKGAM